MNRFHFLTGLLLLISVGLFAQNTNIYRDGDQYVVNAPNAKTSYPYSSIFFRAVGSTIYVQQGSSVVAQLTPTQFVDRSGNPWGANAPAAIDAIVTASKAAAGTVSVASFGTTQPTNATVTSPTTITLTNAIYVLVENFGSSTANGNITYGNVTYTMLPGEGREFRAIYDYSSNKYAPPFTTATLTPLAGATMCYTIVYKQ